VGFVLFAFLLFGFCFVVGPFSYVFAKPRKYFITKNLITTYKLSTVEDSQREKLFHNLGFRHSLGEIATEEEKIGLKKKEKNAL
jgi:hypothetical protein